MTNILTVNVYNSCFFLSLVIFFFFLLLLYSNFRSNCLNFHSNLWAQWNLRSNSKRCLCECGVVCKIRNYVELNSGINFILSYNTLHMFNINFWWILMKNVISNSVTSMSVCVCVYLHKSNFITILLVIIPPKKNKMKARFMYMNVFYLVYLKFMHFIVFLFYFDFVVFGT